VPVKRELLRQGQRLSSRGLEPRRGVARDPPVGAPGGEPFSVWGKILRHCDFCFPIPLHFLICRSFFYAHPFSFLRLKRTLEQAQPSMAKRLKAGAVSKGPGLQLTSGLVTLLCWLL